MNKYERAVVALCCESLTDLELAARNNTEEEQ